MGQMVTKDFKLLNIFFILCPNQVFPFFISRFQPKYFWFNKTSSEMLFTHYWFKSIRDQSSVVVSW